MGANLFVEKSVPSFLAWIEEDPKNRFKLTFPRKAAD
jgi:hypothetical protein